MFSSRVPSNLEQNRIARAVRRARDEGRALIDLTVTNPTSVGIAYPQGMLDALASSDAVRYEPAAFGLAPARAAVCADYARRGVAVDPANVVLTASTSEAYSLLFKLLCAPDGDAVLVPTPSYPLFDHLTALDGVRPIPYRLDFHGRWTIALDDLDGGWTKAVRAVLAVSPNNPTGSVLAGEELDALAARCAERRAALIVDEVFADYLLVPATATRVQAELPTSCLTFRLGGLSKSAGLPQVKLGWIAASGPGGLVRDALARLELICDAYLSVATPVQVAAPSLIAAGAGVRASLLERIRGNYDALVRQASAHPAIHVLPVEGGWSAVLRVPSTRREEDLVLELLERDEVLIHPGLFFDFPHEAFLVCSLLPEPQLFADGVRRLMERVDA
jgi:aspartate/methionine/tyrosine aminotransferase